jgi:hypothetical protein
LFIVQTERKKEVMKNKTESKRTRNFATVVYPESAPENWLEILAEAKIPALVSPLHDRDVNPTGEVKKAHYHVLILFEGVKTSEQAKEVFDTIGGVGLEIVQSIRGYARYLCHLDNPDKYRYEQADVRQFGGADFVSIIGLATDRYQAIAEMIDYCHDHDIIEFSDLLEYARLERFEWFRILCDNGAFVMREHIKSRRLRRDRLMWEGKIS